MKNKTLAIVAAILGIVFIVLAIIYWSTPASSLPSFLPGYDPALNAIHIKHGIASFVVGIVLLAFTWFQTGKKSA